MSCIIDLIPIAIFAAVDIGAALGSEIKDKLEENKKNNNFVPRDVINIITQKYETSFTDSNLLIKTLKEHGAENFSASDNDDNCTLNSIPIDFCRKRPGAPFSMQISMQYGQNPDECKNVETLSELSEEYKLNVQEESYNKIKEKLKTMQIEIEIEEITDDNSIVITVNI